MKRIGGLFLAFLGVALATFGIVRGTTNEDSTIVEVTIPAGEAQMMYTAPGVLHLVNDTVEVSLTAPEGEIHWGVGSTQDVEDFIGDAAAVKVTGLSDWDTPTYEELPGTPEGVDAVATPGADGAWNISQMDQWIESGTGTGTVEFTLDPDQSVQQSLIVSTTTAQAPDMTLTWDRSLVTSNPVPIVVIGVLLALIGGLLLISSRQDASVNKKDAAERRERRERQDADTTVLSRIGDSREEAARTTGGALGAGIMPGAKSDIRERELEESDRLILPEPEADAEQANADQASERNVEDAIATTGGALGVGILPGANTEIRERDLDESDRLVVPEAEQPKPDQDHQANADQTEATDPDATDPDATHPDATDPDGVVDPEDKDWRSLWNFSWGSPWTKGDDNNA